MDKEYKIPKNIKPQDLVRGIINASYWYWNTIDKIQHTEAIEYLNNLQTIDNANPSETMECLERIIITKPYKTFDEFDNDYNNIKQYILKAQEQENKNEILKELLINQAKVLEIVFEKEVDMYSLRICETVEEYNMHYAIEEYQKLIKEEFDLLKRWLDVSSK